MDYESELNCIDGFCDGMSEAIHGVFARWKLRPLAFDDMAALIEQVKRHLIRFALDCNALPVRSPCQLMATVKSIAKKPFAFIEDVGKYDPEAVSRVYGKLSSRSAEKAAMLERFEWGKGPAPTVDDIVQSASQVLVDLEAEAHRFANGGRQKLVLQHKLVQDLARLFEKFGGRLTRITRFNLGMSSSEREDGPFHDFLKIVLPAVRPIARKAGFQMDSIRSLVSQLKPTVTQERMKQK